MNRLSPHAAFWLSIARIYLGAFWLVHGLFKLLGGAPLLVPAWYHGVLARPLLANVHTIAPIVAAVEALVGVLLVFGLFTRFSAFIALTLAAGFFLTKGNYTAYTGMADSSGALIVLALVTFALSADYGVDGIARALREKRKTHVNETRVVGTPVDVKWPE